MSLDKAIKYGKEKRKQYRGSKSFDPHCRNNNRCSACRDNRLYQYNKELLRVESQLKEMDND